MLEMDDVPFKPRAYEKAAESIEALERDVADIYKAGGIEALSKEIPGVGKGIADHIEQLLQKGTFKEYEDLKKKNPVDITELTGIEGIGPKMVRALWKELKIKNLKDLEKAALSGKIRALPHFGERSEKKILKGIEFLKKSGGRKVLGLMMPELHALENTIRAFPGVTRAIIAGSARRRKETIGDIDILVSSSKPSDVMARFVKLPMVVHVYGSGETKTNVRLKNGLDADLRVIPEKSWGAALNYFTGSKEHNVELRKIAIKKGYKLNEYGLFKTQNSKVKSQNYNAKLKTTQIQIAGETEKDLYNVLDMQYIEPELRENTGEIEAAQKNMLPKLIEYGDLKGDLQTQTDWTDGEDSIEEMARAAEAAGLEYIVITDHTKSLAMTGGADEKKLEQQMKEIDRINKKFSAKGGSASGGQGFRLQVLKGAEVNILKDGSLDIADECLAKLDVVGAAIHTSMKLSEKEQTVRIIRAMENPHVDIIFHLTGRIINSREPIALDVDEIIKAAKRTGTILEIDAYPVRLDIKAEYVRKCVEAGVKMAIDSDAHSVQHFKFLEHGIAEARRGWAKKEDVVNTRPLQEFMKLLKPRR